VDEPRPAGYDQKVLANDLLKGITAVWNQEMLTHGRKLRRDGQRRAFSFGVSVGTLTIAKYYLRSVNGGELWWQGDEELLAAYDEASTRIAESSIGASNGLNAPATDLIRFVERHYPPRRNLRWAKLEGVDDATPVPLHPSQISRANAVAHRVEEQLYRCLMDTFEDESKTAPMTRLVNLMAAGKIALAVFSTEPTVAALAEDLAELSSETTYTARRKEDDDLQDAVAQYTEGVERTLRSLQQRK
jgi:hypothetical protein